MPTYPNFPLQGIDSYNYGKIPPRLYYNWKCNFAKLYNWSTNPREVQEWIHEAFENRNKKNPENSYQSFVNNRTGDRWYE